MLGKRLFDGAPVGSLTCSTNQNDIGHTTLIGRETLVARTDPGPGAAPVRSALLRLFTLLLFVAFVPVSASATIIKGGTIADSTAAAFDPIGDRVGAFIFTDSGGVNRQSGSISMHDGEWGWVTFHQQENIAEGSVIGPSNNPRVTIGDRDLTDGRIEHGIAEFIPYNGPGACLSAAGSSDDCIDGGVFRLANPVTGISPMVYGTPTVGMEIGLIAVDFQGQWPDVDGIFTGQMSLVQNTIDCVGDCFSTYPGVYFSISTATPNFGDVPLEGIGAQQASGGLVFDLLTGDSVGMVVGKNGFDNNSVLMFDAVMPWAQGIMPVPEPSTGLLLSVGLMGLATHARKRRR